MDKKNCYRLVYSIREETYLADKNFINELSKQTIFLGDIERKDSKFYIIPKQLIIALPKNKFEHFKFITTLFQLKVVKECKYLFG